jgi:uncharacterized protein
MNPKEAPEEASETWFADGLRFKCTGCGKCCTGASGSVYVSQHDLEQLAGFLKQPIGAFVKAYTRNANGRRALIDRRHSSDCIFLDGKLCTVYDARPTQCRTYPWWFSNLQDAETWEETRQVCEGVDHPSAHVIPASEILEQCWEDADNEGNLEILP